MTAHAICEQPFAPGGQPALSAYAHTPGLDG